MDVSSWIWFGLVVFSPSRSSLAAHYAYCRQALLSLVLASSPPLCLADWRRAGRVQDIRLLRLFPICFCTSKVGEKERTPTPFSTHLSRGCLHGVGLGQAGADALGTAQPKFLSDAGPVEFQWLEALTLSHCTLESCARQHSGGGCCLFDR
eukprot:s2236_g6.t1